MEQEGFTRRSDYEPPDEGYEPDRLLMCEEIVEDEEEYAGYPEKKVNMAEHAEKTGILEADPGKGGHNDSFEKNENPDKEMGRMIFKKGQREDDSYEEEIVAETEVDEDVSEKETPARPRNRTKKVPPEKKKIRLLPILLIAGLAVLGGVGYIAYEIMSAPDPMPTYRPPVKPRIHPQEKNMTGKPVPAAKGMQNTESASAIAALDLARDTAPSPSPAQSEQRVSAKAASPHDDANRPISPEIGARIEEEMKEIGSKLDEIKSSIQNLRSISNNAQGTQAAGGMPRDVLRDMTREIQALSAKNKSLNGELSAANKKIAELRGIIKKNNGEKRSQKDKADTKQQAKSGQSGNGSTSSWEILGFSGNRVVIADENGTHSVNVGQALNGVKIVSVDVEGGSVKTSAGTLKYGQ